MTDAELIKRVVLKLGWTEIEMSTDHESCPIIKGKLDGARVESRPWDQSVDAALAVLDKGKHCIITWEVEAEVFYVDYDFEICSAEFLPHAILEAFLKASKVEEQP